MSDYAGVMRDYEKVKELSEELDSLIENFYKKVTVPDSSYINDFFRFRLTLLSQSAMCRTILGSIDTIGSRGGCICFKKGKRLSENAEYRKYITVTAQNEVRFEPVDSIPNEKVVFEKLLKVE